MILAILIVLASIVPMAVTLVNRRLYRPPQPADGVSQVLPPVSVLIPARDEEGSIGEAVESVRRQTGIDWELVVLDDDSSDATAAIVADIAAADDRIRLERSQPLPGGWCGKQYACWQLARLARHDRLLYLDADVRLEPHALARTVAMFERLSAGNPRLGMLSGVPRQIVRSLPERLLIPLIHFVLLGFLPIWRMRRSAAPAYAAGCGQFLLCTRRAYERAGGHAAIQASMHDGLMLPQAFRRAGLATDLVDATPLARCRMYDRAAEVWPGFEKNAAEGLAHPLRFPFFAGVFVLGHLLPYAVALASLAMPVPPLWVAASIAAILANAVTRAAIARRYRQPWSVVAWHPVAIAMLLALQSTALAKHLLGRRTRWKGRGVGDAPAITLPTTTHPAASVETTAGDAVPAR